MAPGASQLVLPDMVDAAIGYVGRRFVYWWANTPICGSAATVLAPPLRSRVGKVHIALLLEEAWRGIDFLQGDEACKSQWSNQQMRIVNCYSSYNGWSPDYLRFRRDKSSVRTRVDGLYMRKRARVQSPSLRARRQIPKNSQS